MQQERPRAPTRNCAARPHLSEEALEEAAGQHVPGDAVGDGGEDPVELPQGRLPVRLLPGDPVYELLRQPLRLQQRPRAEPPQGDLQAMTHH